MRRLTWALACVLAGGCSAGPDGPAVIALGADVCGHCRMTIVSTATAAEVIAPGEEPRLFDDIGCLRDDLARAPLPPGAVVYVADHRTGAWVDARTAAITKTSASTPMASGLLAHADAASRDLDPAARGGTAIDAATILAPSARKDVP